MTNIIGIILGILLAILINAFMGYPRSKPVQSGQAGALEYVYLAGIVPSAEH
jgi:hypothetical protein